MCYLTFYVVTATSVWTIPLEAVHVLLCFVFLVVLGLLPNDLELTLTLSLDSERRIDTSDTYTHQACKTSLLEDKAYHSLVMTSKS